MRALADASEARDHVRGEARRARDLLAHLQKNLANIEANDEGKAEEQLIALRDQLLTLGKSESQLQKVQDNSIELGPDPKKEISIIEILELWQNMFRETFQQYHRLSSSLVRSEDATTALRLWQEYLLNVQSFLSGNIPEDYQNLTEHQHLCQVHQNLLATQQSVLLRNGDGQTKFSDELNNESIMEKFSDLTNLHNETLSRIVDRQTEVSNRLYAWEGYRVDQATLLQWLKDMEKEKESLQLRYIHIRRVPKLLSRLQSLIDKVPNGQLQTKNLEIQQKCVLSFCDEAFSASIRIEFAGIVKRIDNLQAGLETWRAFVNRVTELISQYEISANNVQRLYTEVQNIVSRTSDSLPTTRSETKFTVERLRNIKNDLSNSFSDLDSLSVIQEQLKDCLSPQDVKTITQRVWLLRQQQADLDHQITTLIHQLEEKLELDAVFESRYLRLINWMNSLEMRLDKGSHLDNIGALSPQELVKKIDSELQSELSIKEREYEWIMETGKDLMNLSDHDEETYKSEILAKLNSADEKWNRLKHMGLTRKNKINDLLQTMLMLEERLAAIRIWLSNIESQLNIPILLESCTREAVDNKLKEHDKIEESIHNESGEIGEILNLCELLLNDVETWRGNFETYNLRSNSEIIDKKWRLICEASAARKHNLLDTWKLIENLMKFTTTEEDWLKSIERDLTTIENTLENIPQDVIPETVLKIESMQKNISKKDPTLKVIEKCYSDLVKSTCLDTEKLQPILSMAREVITKWRGLNPRIEKVLFNLKRESTLHRQFIDAHGSAVVNLTKADVHLTQIQHLPKDPEDLVYQLDQLLVVEKELEAQSELLQNADEMGLLLMQSSTQEEINSIQEMIDEYQILWKDISVRITQLRRDIENRLKGSMPSDVDESVQVETLKFEQDSAIQVNTLPFSRLTSFTSKDAYMYELNTAIAECEKNLNALDGIISTPEPTENSAELIETAKTITKQLKVCQSNIELIKHLSELLLTDCDCTEEEARLKDVDALQIRFETIQNSANKRGQHIKNLRSSLVDFYALSCSHEAGRLTCPLCSQRNWKQIDNDLWRLEQWLQFAEATQASQKGPPKHIEQLEDAAQDHRELLLDLDSHKSIIMSLNIVGAHLADHTEDEERANALRERLRHDNERWEAVCRAAAAWQSRLQAALLDNAEFHATVEELMAWLASAERSIRAAEPLDLTAPSEIITAKFHKMTSLREELERGEPRVVALQDAAAQLLRDQAAPAPLLCTKLGELRLRVQSLRRLAGVYALKLGAELRRGGLAGALARAAAAPLALAATSDQLLEKERSGDLRSPQHSNNTGAEAADAAGAGPEDGADSELDTSVLRRGLRFLGRVARASLPFQALLLLLLGAAALVPGARDDRAACALGGDFGGFEPVLRYPNGPPPV